jgi:hypothetical protein
MLEADGKMEAETEESKDLSRSALFAKNNMRNRANAEVMPIFYWSKQIMLRPCLWGRISL